MVAEAEAKGLEPVRPLPPPKRTADGRFSKKRTACHMLTTERDVVDGIEFVATMSEGARKYGMWRHHNT